MTTAYAKYRATAVAALVLIGMNVIGPLRAQTLQITSPASGTTVNPGQTASVTVAASGGVLTNVFVIGESPVGWSPVLNSPPYEFAIQIPSTISPRTYRLTATGVDSSGRTFDSDPITIDVERADAPASIDVNLTSLKEAIGDMAYLRVSATYGDASVLDVTESTLVTYTSDTLTVATVDNVGRVTAVGSGSANITIAYGSLSLTVPIVVEPLLKVLPAQTSLYGSETEKFDAYFNPVPNSGSDVTWTLSPSLGTIDADGLYTAPASVASRQGVTVTATSVADPTKSASAQVWILPPVTLALSPPSATLLAGQHLELSANRNNDGGAWVSWSLSPADAGSFWDSQNSSAFPYSIPLGEYTAPSPIVSSQTVTVTASRRNFNQDILMNARAHAWGFYFDVPVVSSQIKEYVRQFCVRPDNPAAAAQADVIAHSMGRPVTRAILDLVDYTGTDSFGQNTMHKLITIGTPHYSTKLAGDLLASPCMAGTLAYFEDMYSFRTATMNGTSVNGAVGDLQGDGKGGSPSAALRRIDDATQIQAVVPTAMIAGEVSLSNLAGLDSFWQQKTALRLRCGSEPLAQKLASSSTWPTECDNLPNDGIVPVSSQLHSASPGPAILGVVRSQGCLGLGFTPPFELGPDSDASAEVQIRVIGLLNASLYASPNSGVSFTLLH
jgi:uncharacterized protein YjdB